MNSIFSLRALAARLMLNLLGCLILLTRLGLALGILNGDTRSKKVIADRAHDTFFLSGLEDVVILVIATDRLRSRKPDLRI